MELGLALVFIGFLLAFVAGIYLAFRGPREKGSRGGGAIIIGPFPIVWGSDKETTKMMLVLSIVLVLILISLSLIPSLMSR